MKKRTDRSTTRTALRLEPGERLPDLTASLPEGGEIELPDHVADGWAVILFYRGHWCPYCRKQLEDFQTNLDRFRSSDVKIVALSADPEKEARKTVESYDIDFPVGYGLDAEGVRETFGAYLGGDGSFVQATGFVLRPGGQIALAVYSSGAVGRLPARDVLGLIDYMRRQEG